MDISLRRWATTRILMLAALISLPLVTFIYRTYAAEEPQPLTTTERLALSSLNERGRVLQEDTRAFYTEACNRRGIKDLSECSIDPTAMTIAHVAKPPAAPAAAPAAAPPK